MNKIKIITGLFTILVAAILIISCSGRKGDSGKVVLEWWQFWTDPVVKPVIEEMVAEFEAAHPNIKVNISDLTWANGHEKIVVAFSSGTAPDIIELGSDWIPEFSSSGQLTSLSGNLPADTSLFYGWQPTEYDGETYAMPWIMGTRVLYINRDLMVKAGFEEDYAPVNWPQMKEICYKIDSLDNDIYGFGSNAAEKHRLYKKWMPFFWSIDGRIISRDGKYSVISSDKAYRALKFYKELTDSCSLIDTQRRLEDAFLAGKVGVIMSGDWLLKRIHNEDHQINFLTSIMPGPKFPGKSFAGGEYLAVNAASSNKDAAVEFITFITNKDNQLKFCKANFSMNPSHKEAAQDTFFTEDLNRKTFVLQMNMTRMPPAVPEWVYIEDIIETTLENVLFNEAPMAESLYEAKFKIAELLKLKQ